MTAKEKARELVDEYQKQIFFDVTNERLDIEEAKGCALIAVNQMISVLPFTDINTSLGKYCENERAYLEEVRHEIQKL